MSAEAFPDRAAAEWALQNWATAHRKRDDLIRLAVAAGVDTHRIHQITGVAKTTITRITERAASLPASRRPAGHGTAMTAGGKT